MPCSHPAGRSLGRFPAQDYVTGEAFEVAVCGGCGAGRTEPAPDATRMARYYPDGYYGAPGQRRFPAAVEVLQRLLYGQRAAAVERLAGRPGRVLDIGCGRGFLLDAFRRRGWEAQGTELDERSSAYAREVLRLPVQLGPVEAWPWPAGHFDAVTMWHVLEHFPDPAAAVALAARLLRPGGVLMIGVPNFASPEARTAGAGWFHLDVPRHLVHLTPAWLAEALGEAGVEVRRWSHLAPEFDLFSFVQSAENRIGLRQNLLYDVLRGRSAKVLQGTGRAGPLASAAALVAAVPLTLLGLPTTALLAAARRGSSVTVFGTRRA